MLLHQAERVFLNSVEKAERCRICTAEASALRLGLAWVKWQGAP